MNSPLYIKMNQKRDWSVLKPVWCVWIQVLLALHECIASNSTSENEYSDGSFVTDDMITGLLAGFGFFVGLIAIVCIMWCFCCGNGCNKAEPVKRRVGPSPPPWRSRPGTRATTANTMSTRVTTTQSSRRT